MADITIVNGVYKPTYNWGAPSCSYNLLEFVLSCFLLNLRIISEAYPEFCLIPYSFNFA